jgi:hypothetical protein
MAALMNEGRLPGSRYRGRLLMSLHLFESESRDNAAQRAGGANNYSGVNDLAYFELKHANELLPTPVAPLTHYWFRGILPLFSLILLLPCATIISLVHKVFFFFIYVMI